MKEHAVEARGVAVPSDAFARLELARADGFECRVGASI